MTKHFQILDSLKLYDMFLEMASLPFRFLTPFSIRPSRLLRNSLRSNILAGRLCRLPSNPELRRLNLQWLLHPFQKPYSITEMEMLPNDD